MIDDDHYADRMALLWLMVWLREPYPRRRKFEHLAALRLKRLHGKAAPDRIGRALVAWARRDNIELTEARRQSLISIGARLPDEEAE